MRGRAPLLLSYMNMRSVASWLRNALTRLGIHVLLPFRASKKKPLLGIRGYGLLLSNVTGLVFPTIHLAPHGKSSLI